jgi:hypothetical protein
VGAVVSLTVVGTAGSSAAGSIVAPPPHPFSVPLTSVGSGPAPFPIAVTGFPPNVQVFAMICDGVSPSAPGWDPTLDCDNVTSPAGRPTGATGSASWDPANRNQQIGVFDGAGPSATFNCLYPGQPAPNNGSPSWGSNVARPSGGGIAGCQLRVATTNAAVTADQTFVTLVLPRPTCVSNCQAGIGSAAPGHITGSPASLRVARDPAASATGVAGVNRRASGRLAYTGDDDRRLVLIGLKLIFSGLLLAGLAKRRRRGRLLPGNPGRRGHVVEPE